MEAKVNSVEEDRAIAQGLVDFVNASPSPFHTVDTAKKLLSKAGFVQLCEKQSWAESLKKGKTLSLFFIEICFQQFP